MAGIHSQDIQYQALLRLTGHKLNQFILNAAIADDEWIKAALKGPDVEPDVIVDAPPLEGPDGGHEPDPPVLDRLPPLLPLPLDRDLMEWVRCKATWNLKQITIYFDHFTGGGRSQRGYGNCLRHENCFRWRVCSNFNTKKEFAAYIYAWAVTGESCADREEHMFRFDPRAEDVTRALDNINLMDF